ncbi:TMEM165/GDT1 family protein [Leptolyngbya sp. AN02str]|uniref:TMEM165/GDT1 family protein n=1 Tax=Leptolyngbya sp. AN02str TaxID=3423363 RepID=UPI003D3206F3
MNLSPNTSASSTVESATALEREALELETAFHMDSSGIEGSSSQVDAHSTLPTQRPTGSLVDSPVVDSSAVTVVAIAPQADASHMAHHHAELTWQAELKIFLSTFATIFLAEVGDKTQMTVLLMSAESKSPWTVFVGAGAALIATSLCGVLLGRWLAQRIPPQTLDRAAGVLLLGISALLLLDVLGH